MPSRRDVVRLLLIAGITILAVYIFIMFTIVNNYCCIDFSSKVIIEKATLTKIGNNQYDLSISVREVGGASTTIQKVVITGGGLTNEQECTGEGQDTTLYAGQSKLLIYRCDLPLRPDVTYYVRVYYQKGTSSEATDLYPVTVR